MDIIKKNGLVNLTKKASAIFGAALAALTGINSNASISAPIEKNTTQIREIGKVKPMPVLKLNPSNPQNSIFVALHGSHSSHSSHSSHYSHRSGAMFS